MGTSTHTHTYIVPSKWNKLDYALSDVLAQYYKVIANANKTNLCRVVSPSYAPSYAFPLYSN